MELANVEVESSTCIRTEAFEAFAKLCTTQNHRDFKSLSRDIRRQVDNQMIQSLLDAGYDVPAFMYEIGKQLSTNRVFSAGSSDIFNAAEKQRQLSGVIPLSQLHVFLYDYPMFQSLKDDVASPRPTPNSTVRLSPHFNESLIADAYHNSHEAMTKTVKKWITAQKKARKWNNRTKFQLEEVLELREEFFTSIGTSDLKAPKKGKVLTVMTPKGGVGKSSISISLAGALAYTANRNNKVLVIDCDYQMSATSSLITRDQTGAVLSDQTPSVNLLLKTCAQMDLSGADNSKLREEFEALCMRAPLKSSHPNIDIIPSSNDFTFDYDYQVASDDPSKTLVSPDALMKVLDVVNRDGVYDYVIIDTRPDLHNSAVLAYFCADEIISVTKPNGYDYDSFAKFSETMGMDIIPSLGWHPRYESPSACHLLINQFTSGNSSQEHMISLAEHYAKRTAYGLLETVIPNSTCLSTSSSQESTIWNVGCKVDSGIDNKAMATFRGYFTQLALKLK